MEKFDKVLLIIASTIFIIGTTYLVVDLDYMRQEDDLTTSSIAKISKKSRTVKSKRASSLSWSEVYKGQLLYENDQVYTHENSTVTIIFSNKVRIKLNENTLIKLVGIDQKESKNNNDKPNQGVRGLIKIIKGNIELDTVDVLTPLNFDIQVNEDIYKLKKIEEVVLKVAKINGEGNFELLSGKVDLINKGKKIRLVKGDLLEAGSTEKSSLDITVSTPIENQQFIISKTPDINFKWSLETNLKISTATIVIAEDTKFKNIIITNELNHNSFRYILDNAKPGIFYWKLSFKSNNKTYSTPNYSFRLVDFTTPSLIYPANEDIIYLKQSQMNTAVKLKWVETGYDGTTYTVNITKNEKGKKVNDTFKSNYRFNSAEPGIYQWKVRASHSELGETPWSKESRFLIVASTLISGLKPYRGETETISKPKEKIFFSWSGIASYHGKYEFSLSSTSDFSKDVQTIRTSKRKVSIAFENDGLYYWKIDAGGKGASGAQEVYIVQSEIPKPLKLPKKNRLIKRKSKKESYEISWPEHKYAKAYVIEIYRDSYRNKKIVIRKVKKNRFIWEGQRAGVYYYRISIIDNWGRKSRFSKLSKLVTPLD